MSGSADHPKAEVWTVTVEHEYSSGNKDVYVSAICRTRAIAVDIQQQHEAKGDRAWINSWGYDEPGGMYRGAV